MFSAQPLPLIQDQTVWLVIDPAAGGPGSDYAMVSLVRQRGTVTVSPPEPPSRDAVPVPARLHEPIHRLVRAEEAHHKLVPQVQQKARNALFVLHVHQQNTRLQRVVDVQQQVKHSQQLRVRRVAHQRAQLRNLRARALRKKLLFQRRNRLVYESRQPLPVQRVHRLLQHVRNVH